MSDEPLSLETYFPPTAPSAAYDDWVHAATAALKGRPLASIIPKGPEPIERSALYTAAEPAPTPSPRPLSLADHASRREHGWQICARLHGNSTDAIKAALQLACEQGAHSVWWPQPPHPSQGGHSPDAWEAITSAAAALNIPLTIDADEHVEAHMSGFVDAMRAIAPEPSTWRGGLLADPIGIWASRGALTRQWQPIWEEVAALVSWASQEAPQLKTLCSDGLVYHNAGAHASQEIGFLLAHVVDTFRALEGHGISPDQAAPGLLIRTGLGRNMFTEIAKLRALRLCLAKVFGACGVSAGVTIHSCGSGLTQSQRDPWVNLLRSTAACFSGAIGGADMVSLLPFDQALAPETPSTLGQRQAINIQHVLALESHLHKVIDPAGGSWYLEHLTDQLARDAWTRFQQIEGQGGLRAALQEGSLQASIEETKATMATALGKRKAPLLGVSEYANLGEDLPAQPQASLATLAEPASDDLPHSQPLLPYRFAEGWERLRDASDAYLATHGKRPQVFLLNLGPIPVHKARAGFATRFFEAGGFECIGNDGFDDAEAAAKAFAESDAIGAVICSSDEIYQTWVEPLAQALKGAAFLAVAGKMGEHESAWREAGVSHAIYLGCPALTLLQELQQIAGVQA